MKSKKAIAAILIVVCLLVCGVLLWQGISHKNAPPVDNGSTDVEKGEQPTDIVDSGEDQQEAPDEAAVLEDGGDLVIVIPDDQESGGL